MPHEYNKKYIDSSWHMFAAVSNYQEPYADTGFLIYYNQIRQWDNEDYWQKGSWFFNVTDTSKRPFLHDIVTDSSGENVFITDPGYRSPYNNRVSK
jgi:hypothetical protein